MSVLEDLLARKLPRSEETLTMAGISYANDPLSRALMRGLLLLQPAALIAVLILSLLDLFLLAMAISMLTLFIFVAIVVWLYLRYRKLPVVCEKRMLKRLVDKFRRRLRGEVKTVQAARLERNRLVQAEEDEVGVALSLLQQDAIQRKFKALHDQNDALERRAISSRQILEHEIMLLAPRLRQLAPFTFLGYLSRSLASREIVAALIALLLIATQVLSSVSAMGAAFIASLPTETGASDGICHPSYPGVCIPPPPPDLECGDISYRRFQVLPPDPHHFDGDADRIGCESG